MSAKTWIVELEPGVWIAPWVGDPGRTLVQAHAVRFTAPDRALFALAVARRFRPFKRARILENR